MTAASGDPSRATGSSAAPSPPTGLPTGSGSSEVAPVPAVRKESARAARRAKRRRRSSGSRLFRYDRSLGPRFVAGADEAGRGCLAGPLVAAAVLFHYDAPAPSHPRSLSALNHSKQHTPEARDGLYPRGPPAAPRRRGHPPLGARG